VTPEREYAINPRWSPDGRSIAYESADPDPLKTSSGVYVMDRNGGERRRVTPEREYAINPRWSPDGRSIAYESADPADLGQGSEIHVVDAASPGTPKNCGRGVLWGWIGPRAVLAFVSGAPPELYVAAVDDTLRKRCFADSTIAIPLLGGKYFLHADLRDTLDPAFELRENAGPTMEELLRGPGDRVLPTYGAKKRPFPLYAFPFGGWNFTNQAASYVGFWKQNTEVWKYHFVTGKEEQLTVRFPEFKSGIRAATNQAGTEVVYAAPRLSAKLVMIEQVFR
jgi:hypothetical protein